MKSDWKIVKLGDVCKICYGKDHKKLNDGVVPAYGTGGLMRYVDRSIHNKRSVLIPRKGTLSNLFLVEPPFWTVDTLFWTDVDVSKITPEYLYYYLRTVDLASKNVGTAVPSLTTALLNGVSVALPPLETQRKIAAILSALDDKIELNRRINTNLEQQTQALYRSWFIDFLPFNGIKPQNWTVSALGEITKMGAGGDKPEIVVQCKTNECPYPIYSNGISEAGLYGYTNEPKINVESVTVSARGTIGFVCLRPIPYVPIVRLITLIPNNEIVSAKFLYLCLQELNIAGTGTTQQQLTVPDFKKRKILVPDKETMARFTEAITPSYEKCWANEEENKQLAALRDALLPRLMAGELGVSDVLL